MAVSETVVRESSSYRQGPVLGFTMAEIILLIVFALLIALAAVWRAEHTAKMELEKEITSLKLATDPANLALFASLSENYAPRNARRYSPISNALRPGRVRPRSLIQRQCTSLRLRTVCKVVIRLRLTEIGEN
jgi:hypothetical protein